MGREVRRVPANWVHPRNERGEFKPMFDQDFGSVAREWLDDAIAWDNGTHENLLREPTLKDKYPFFWQWDDNPPDPEHYRPAWTEAEATHYQMYETVSEGTPVSPVFATPEELVDWIVQNLGHSRHAAEEFVKSGYAPTMMVASGHLAMNIDTFDLTRQQS
jgi:hypothetical protein